MPKVTVVTPNYNYARYLPQRLESILAQTYRDFELIILDNASTDNSREVIESYAKDPRVKAIFNAKNNGSTFKQWRLGLSHAKGDYIWFAESDDYADHSLLETLVDRLDRHPSVGLAVCQSWTVDQDDKPLGNYRELQEELNKSTHWREDYVNAGQDECKKYLFWHNTIPNASAVLLRRSTLNLCGGVPKNMLLNGDWMTYVKMLSISDIAFVSTPLNFFRHHPSTVRNRLSSGKVGIEETLMVHRQLIDRCGLPDGLDFASYVNVWISHERRNPYHKVPLDKTLALISRFARLHPRALKIALPMLTWELMADAARRAGVVTRASRVKKTVARGTQ